MVVKVLVPALDDDPFGGGPLDLSVPLVWTIDGVLDAAECDQLVQRIEALGPEAAPITTSRGFEMRPDVRNNTRVMFDDVALAAGLFERVRETLPGRMRGDRAPVGLNERFRCYRYGPGQQFAPHYDGSFQRDATEESLLTFMIYLNDACEGGATNFYSFSKDISVVPAAGRALVFQHRLLHEGATVDAGVKYVLRSDVMYRRT